MISCRTMNPKKKNSIVKIQGSIGKTNFLTSKIPWQWFRKEYFKIATTNTTCINWFLNSYFWGSTIGWTIEISCGNFFKKVDHIQYKILTFEVKKRILFTPCKIKLVWDNWKIAMLKWNKNIYIYIIIFLQS